MTSKVKRYINLSDSFNLDRPILIIALGPTGSGKGSIPSKVLDTLKLPNNIVFEEILIDNLVENNLYYKNEIRGFIKRLREKYQQEYPGLDQNGLIKIIVDNLITNQDTLTFFNNVYFHARKKVPCLNPTFETLKTCDEINDERLDKAFKEGKNIVFETTGEYYPKWLFDLWKNEIKAYQYQIVLSYSVVEICELIRRNYNRAKESMIEFISNENVPAPRLPDIRLSIFKNKIRNIVDTFNKNVLTSTCNYIYDGCNIRILVFDNNTRKRKIIYDSNSGNTHSEILSGFKYDVALCRSLTGGKKKSKRRSKK